MVFIIQFIIFIKDILFIHYGETLNNELHLTVMRNIILINKPNK